MTGATAFVITGEVPVMTGANGAAVSTANDSIPFAEFGLPAASLNAPVTEVTVPTTPLRPFVGVNVNVYWVGEMEVKALIVPSDATREPLKKFTDGSLSVAVTMAVCPIRKDVEVDAKETVGAT